MFPIIWQIRRLEEAVAADELAEGSIRKLTLFKQFYMLVVSYVYFTRIVVYLVASTLPYNSAWLAPFLSELATFLFYGTVGWKFRPVEKNPYLQLRRSDDDENGNMNLEEFGLNDEDDDEEEGGPNAL